MAERCGRAEETAELALGLLSGGERAEALAHLSGCDTCRSEVEQLGSTADRLLLLVPPAEPPPGFESDVLAAMGVVRQPHPAARRARRRWRSVALAATVSMAAAFAVGWAVWSPRETLPPVREAAMVTPSGRDVGEIRLQPGEPPLLVMSVPGWKRWDDQAGRALDYALLVDLSDGGSFTLDGVRLSESGAWATTPEFDLAAVETVSIIDESGRVWCTGRLSPSGNPNQ